MLLNTVKKEAIIKQFKEQQTSPKDLAKQYDVPLTTVYRWLQQSVVVDEPESYDGHSYTVRKAKAFAEQLIAEYKNGESLQSLKLEHGLPMAVVLHFVRSGKVVLRDEDKLVAENEDLKSQHSSDKFYIEELEREIKNLRREVLLYKELLFKINNIQDSLGNDTNNESSLERFYGIDAPKQEQ